MKSSRFSAKYYQLQKYLFIPVDSASLVFFRIAFGAVMFWEVTRYFNHNWIKRYWIDPKFYFVFEGFEWVRPWDGNGMYVHFLVLGILAVFIMIGFLYRISTILFFLGFTQVFLLDKSNYLNHFYLIVLLSFLLIFLPAHRRFSIDAHIGLSKASDKVPFWAIFTLQLQLGLVYFFGGIAKMNPDWLVGIPIGKWLARSGDFPIFGPYFTETWAVMLFAYGGLLLDLLAAPLLFWRKTRLFIFVILVLFHLSNAHLFVIGIFPWFMIAATTIFFESNWCNKIIPSMGQKITTEANPLPTNHKTITLSLLSIYFLIQIFLPLRHFLLYPGNPSWTEEGHRFAWHMKLRSKSGTAKFKIVDTKTKETWYINPKKFLTKRQAKKMQGQPDMIRQFSHYLARYYKATQQKDVEVYVEAFAVLNGHKPARLLIDPTVDLSKEKASLFTYHWIIPWEKGLMPKNYPPFTSTR